MNARQKRFVAAYVAHGVGRRAAIEAGYKESRADTTASELLRNPEVALAIERGQEEARERLGIDRDWVVRKAAEAVELSMVGVPKLYQGKPVKDEDGNVIMDRDMAGVVGNLNTLVRTLGLGAPKKVEHDHQVVYTLHIDSRPPALEIGEAE